MDNKCYGFPMPTGILLALIGLILSIGCLFSLAGPQDQSIDEPEPEIPAGVYFRQNQPLTAKLGETFTIDYFMPEGMEEVKWHSDNKEVITPKGDALLAIGEGAAIITGKSGIYAQSQLVYVSLDGSLNPVPDNALPPAYEPYMPPYDIEGILNGIYEHASLIKIGVVEVDEVSSTASAIRTLTDISNAARLKLAICSRMNTIKKNGFDQISVCILPDDTDGELLIVIKGVAR